MKHHLLYHVHEELLVVRVRDEELVPHLNEGGADVLYSLLPDALILPTDLVKDASNGALCIHEKNGRHACLYQSKVHTVLWGGGGEREREREREGEGEGREIEDVKRNVRKREKEEEQM